MGMLFSLALMMLCGIAAGWLCKRLRLPALFGMLLVGVLLGPHMLDLIDGHILDISSELRRIALIIILTRAGLSLDISDLKRVGRPAVLMCFVPACFEMLGMVLLAPRLMGILVEDALVMGAVIAAVSPAVIVPKMIRLMEEGYGTKKGIPQMILAAASVDDVFVIVLFSIFSNLAQRVEAAGVAAGNGSAGVSRAVSTAAGTMSAVSWTDLVKIPVSILLGIVVGLLVGRLFAMYFEKVHIRDTVKMIILMSTFFLLDAVESKCSQYVPFSALIAIMAVGIMLREKRRVAADRLAVRFNKLWVGAELLLFILVGATVDLDYVAKAGAAAVLLIFGALAFRMLGVFLCLLRTELTGRERLFSMIAYMPKATVQAAIGGIPLAMGLGCGNAVLTVAVLAILITAPLGAFLIDLTYRRLLQRDENRMEPGE